MSLIRIGGISHGINLSASIWHEYGSPLSRRFRGDDSSVLCAYFRFFIPSARLAFAPSQLECLQGFIVAGTND